MSKPRVRVHFMSEGEVLVTGTDDVSTARTAALDAIVTGDDWFYDEPDDPDGDRWQRRLVVEGEPFGTGFGHFIPTAPGSWYRESEGWRFMWYAGHGELGRPGTTRYVEWRP